MRKTLVLSLVLILVSSLAAFAADPSSTSNLPKFLVFNHEEIKIGKMGEHDTMMRQLLQNVNSANADWHWIAASSVTGTSSDYLGIGMFNTYTDIEKGLQAQDKVIKISMQNADYARETEDTHQSRKITIVRLRPELSYQAEKVNFANARFWDVTIIQVKPGADDDFIDLAKDYVELHKKGNIDVSWATYSADYGTTSPVFVYITPRQSLAELDVDREAQYKAVFTPPVTKRLDSFSTEYMTRIESILVQVRPDISHPPQTIVAANPDFWNVKETVAESPTPKGKKKKAPVEPAAMKEKEQPK